MRRPTSDPRSVVVLLTPAQFLLFFALFFAVLLASITALFAVFGALFVVLLRADLTDRKFELDAFLLMMLVFMLMRMVLVIM